MKRFLLTAAIIATTVTIPALAADVGISLNIGQPGFYGRLDIGGYPQPDVIYVRPKHVERRQMDLEPVYMRVPRNHSRQWRKNCYKYNACGERVYFVQDNWYNSQYIPRYQEQNSDRRYDRRDD